MGATTRFGREVAGRRRGELVVKIVVNDRLTTPEKELSRERPERKTVAVGRRIGAGGRGV